MISYRVEYRRIGVTGWAHMEIFDSLNGAVRYTEKQGKLDWFQDYDFRIVKRIIAEEEVWTRNTQ